MNDAMEAQLIAHEGLRLKPYRDTKGKLTIGVGRNLDDVGISRGEALGLLANDIQRAEHFLDLYMPWWTGLDPIRQRVLIDMMFNMGPGDERHGLRSFRNTLQLIKDGDYERASANMLLSKWATDVGTRAHTLSQMMKTGLAPNFEKE